MFQTLTENVCRCGDEGGQNVTSQLPLFRGIFFFCSNSQMEDVLLQLETSTNKMLPDNKTPEIGEGSGGEDSSMSPSVLQL